MQNLLKLGLFLQLLMFVLDAIFKFGTTIIAVFLAVSLAIFLLELACFILKRNYYKLLDLRNMGFAFLVSLNFCVKLLICNGYIPINGWTKYNFVVLGYLLLSQWKARTEKKHHN